MTPRWFVGLLVGFALAGALIIVRQPPPSRGSADFLVSYSAARVVREDGTAAVYEQAKLTEMVRRVAPDAPVDPRLTFNLPLAATVPYMAVSGLPVDIAYRVWQVAGIGFMLAALVALQRAVPLGSRALGWGMLALLASAPAWASLSEGQPGPLLLVGAALLLAAAAGGGVWESAVGAACLALKPQYVPAYLSILLAARRWRALAAGTAGAAAVGLSPLLAGGWTGLLGMVHNAVAADGLVPLRLSESWVGAGAPLLPAPAVSGIRIAVIVVTTAALLFAALRRPVSPIPFAALAASLAVLASPHSLPHDLVLLAVPAWAAFALARAGRLPSPVPGLALIQLALLADLYGLPVTVGPVVMTVVLAWYARRFRRPEARRAAVSRQAA